MAQFIFKYRCNIKMITVTGDAITALLRCPTKQGTFYPPISVRANEFLQWIAVCYTEAKSQLTSTDNISFKVGLFV